VSNFSPRIDFHIVVIAVVISIGAALMLKPAHGAFASIVCCQFPLLARATSPVFRGVNYLITNQIIIVLLAFGFGYLIE
jgi:hypothetical protein